MELYTYLQPTVKAPSSYMYYQWFGNSVPGGRGRSSCSTWSRCESVYGHITIFCVSLGCLLPSVCPLAVCYPLCAPWLSVTLCVPLGSLLPSVCPLAVCYPLCVPWLSVTLTVCPLAVCYPLCAPWLSVILCVPLGSLLPSVCPLAVCYPLCAPWLSVTLCVPLGCLLPSVCPLAVCYPLCAPWQSVTLCVPLGCLLPSVCPLAVCYPLCVSWLSVTLTVVANLKLALYMECGCPLDNFSSINLVPRLLWGKGLPQQQPRNEANVSQTSSRRLCRGSHELRARMPARGLL